MSVERQKYCVVGVWKASKTEKWMEVTGSSTGEIIAEVPCCTVDEVEEAIASAHAAFPAWSQTSLSKRTQMMFKWRDILMAHLDELTVLCAKELGKKLEAGKVALKIKVGEGGRTFGSVSSKEIAIAVKEQMGYDVDKKKIQLKDAIKTLGTHNVPVKLHPKVTAELKVIVTEE